MNLNIWLLCIAIQVNDPWKARRRWTTLPNLMMATQMYIICNFSFVWIIVYFQLLVYPVPPFPYTLILQLKAHSSYLRSWNVSVLPKSGRIGQKWEVLACPVSLHWPYSVEKRVKLMLSFGYGNQREPGPKWSH